MGIRFGPGGNSDSFKNGRLKFPEDLHGYLQGFGLDAYELECGRGVNIAEKTYELMPALITLRGIEVSLHAPYYISISSEKEEIRRNSIGYILLSAHAAKKLGARRIVVHAGSCGKLTREAALALAKDTLHKARLVLLEKGLEDIIICLETMGKVNQLGTLDEVMELCKVSESFLPCVDFGHMNARTHGGIKMRANYADILDAVERELGLARARIMHIHFSKIEYSKGGEKKHLTFADNGFGPDYKPLLEELKARAYTPVIICESAGTQAEDAAEMTKYYKRLTT